jgi:hypothetical protein
MARECSVPNVVPSTRGVASMESVEDRDVHVRRMYCTVYGRFVEDLGVLYFIC